MAEGARNSESKSVLIISQAYSFNQRQNCQRHATVQDDLMNQNCLIQISHAPARSLDRAQQSPKLWWWRRRWERRWWHWRWWYWWSGNNDGWGLSDEPVSSYSHTHARTPDPGGNRMKATKPKTVNVDVDDDNDDSSDDIDDLATMWVVVALFTRSSQDAGLEATEPKSEQGATFKVAILRAPTTTCTLCQMPKLKNQTPVLIAMQYKVVETSLFRLAPHICTTMC